MLTQERLKYVFSYNPETGLFTRLVAISRKSKVGEIVGTINKNGYTVIRLDNETNYCHRLAWLYMTGSYPTNHIDHINGNRSDNRFCNLRDVLEQINHQNIRKPHKDSKSGFIGVTKDKKKWASYIYINGKQTRIGSFNTPEEAHAAYIEAKRVCHDGCTI